MHVDINTASQSVQQIIHIDTDLSGQIVDLGAYIKVSGIPVAICILVANDVSVTLRMSADTSVGSVQSVVVQCGPRSLVEYVYESESVMVPCIEFFLAHESTVRCVVLLRAVQAVYTQIN